LANKSSSRQQICRRDGKEKVGERAWRKYDKPDAGLWEFRTRAEVHTYSAVMSWAACDRLAKIARRLELPERAAYWHGHAARMKEDLAQLKRIAAERKISLD